MVDFLRSGCCSNLEGPDFSKVKLENINGICRVSHVNWCEKSFLFALSNLISLPILIRVVDSLQWSPSYSHLSARTFLEISAFLFNILKIIKFHRMIILQPEWPVLQSVWMKVLGFNILALGIFLYSVCVAAYGTWDTFFRLDFWHPGLLAYKKLGNSVTSLWKQNKQEKGYKRNKKKPSKRARPLHHVYPQESSDSVDSDWGKSWSPSPMKKGRHRSKFSPHQDEYDENEWDPGEDIMWQEEGEEEEERCEEGGEENKGSKKMNTFEHFQDLGRVTRSASFFLHMGYCLILASQAGMLVALLQGLSNYIILSF